MLGHRAGSGVSYSGTGRRPAHIRRAQRGHVSRAVSKSSQTVTRQAQQLQSNRATVT
jgi:hypothetical protein